MKKRNLLNGIIILTSFILIGCGGGSSSEESTNRKPIVNAGKDISTVVNQQITIVGSAHDEDGIISTYEWKKGNDTLGTELSLTYIPTEIGVDKLTLIAVDDDGDKASDSMNITVTEEDTPSLPSTSNLPITDNKVVFQKGSEEAKMIKGSVQNLSWAYYTDKKSKRWYISPVKSTGKVVVYSLTDFKDGKNGWGTVGENVASFNLQNETVSIGHIADNPEHRYYDAGWKEWNVDAKIQKDIEYIRNSTVNIKWWFFQASNGSWYIINKNGDTWKFSSKVKNRERVYDWIKIDMGGAKPTFLIENGLKKIKFKSGTSSSTNPSEPDWDSGFYHHQKDSNGKYFKGYWYRGYAPKRFYNYSKGEYSELDKCKSTGVEALGNCTWYAKSRARELGGTIPYSTWGNANAFDEYARNAGYTIDNNPRVGDIAQHNKNTYGHVAVVEKVNSDGTIVISESSYAPCLPSWNFLHRIRTVKVSTFENYIHVK